MYQFKELDTYNKAVRLAAIVELTAQDFPKTTFYFVNRLIRSAESVHQNIGKAHELGNEKNKKNYYWRSRGAIQECFGFIEIASRQGFISPNLRDMFRIRLDELNQMIQGNIRQEAPPTVGSSVLQGPALENSSSEN